jgi:hypothetical protein
MSRFKRYAFTISIVLNVLIIADGIWSYFTDRVGVLTQSIEVGHFASGDVLFTLPKGLAVRDVSPQGLGAIGQFEPYRFAIVITTGHKDAVDYSVDSDSLPLGKYMYSMDLRGQKEVK